MEVGQRVKVFSGLSRGNCPYGTFQAPSSSAARLFRSSGIPEVRPGCFVPTYRRTTKRTVVTPAAPLSKRAPRTVKPPRAPRTTSTVTKAPSGFISSRDKQLLKMINSYRAKNGVGPLTINKRLQVVAKRHSAYMKSINTTGHVLAGHPDGAQPFQRTAKFGYRCRMGENILSFPNGWTPQQAFEGWKNSPGHRATMLNPSWKVIGIGDSNTFWTTVFGSCYDGLEIR